MKFATEQPHQRYAARCRARRRVQEQQRLAVTGDVSMLSAFRSFDPDEDNRRGYDGNTDSTRQLRQNVPTSYGDGRRVGRMNTVSASAGSRNNLSSDRTIRTDSTSSGRDFHDVISQQVTSFDVDTTDSDNVNTIIYRSLLGAFPSIPGPDEGSSSFVVDQGLPRSTTTRAYEPSGLAQERTMTVADDVRGRLPGFNSDSLTSSSPEFASLDGRVTRHIPFSVCYIDEVGKNRCSQRASAVDVDADKATAVRHQTSSLDPSSAAEVGGDSKRSTERLLNDAMTRLVDGLVDCLRRQSPVSNADGGDSSTLDASISKLRDQFIRLSMTAVCDVLTDKLAVCGIVTTA